MARIIDCPCGHNLVGGDAEELFRLARERVDHPEMARTDEERRARVAADARDYVEERVKRGW